MDLAVSGSSRVRRRRRRRCGVVTTSARLVVAVVVSIGYFTDADVRRQKADTAFCSLALRVFQKSARSAVDGAIRDVILSMHNDDATRSLPHPPLRPMTAGQKHLATE